MTEPYAFPTSADEFADKRVLVTGGTRGIGAAVVRRFQLAGARVVLAPPQVLHSPPLLADLIREAGITFACLPPAVLKLLTAEQFPGLRTLLNAGEELPSDLVAPWLRPGLEFYNDYGPTEASMGATFMRLDATVPLPPP